MPRLQSRRQPIYPSFGLVVSRHWWLFVRFPSRSATSGPPAYQPRPTRISEDFAVKSTLHTSSYTTTIGTVNGTLAQVGSAENLIEAHSPTLNPGGAHDPDAITEPTSMRLQPLTDDALSEVSALILHTGENTGEDEKSDESGAKKAET